MYKINEDGQIANEDGQILIIVVVGKDGSSGKTTLTKHFLVPQLSPNVKRVQIETSNSGDGEPDVELAGKYFSQIAGELNMADAGEEWAIDIGSSNFPLMMERFKQFPTTREAITDWLVPVVQTKKSVTDTINTIESLLEIGVAAERITVIRNNITEPDTLEKDFFPLERFRPMGVNLPLPFIHFTQLFEDLKGSNMNVFDVFADKLDRRALRKEAMASSDPEEAMRQLMVRTVNYDLAANSVVNLREVFAATPLFKG